MQTQVPLHRLSQVIDGTLEDPGQVLGAHPVTVAGREVMSVRAYLPEASQVWLLDQTHQVKHPMRRIHPAGFFEGVLPQASTSNSASYQLLVQDTRGNLMSMADPYSVPSRFSDFDLHLFNAGNHRQIYERLGAHPAEHHGIAGVHFAVWAPNAQSIQVIGDFNHWDGRQHAMQKRVPSGIWELFVPAASVGQKYKFRVRGCHGEVIDKTDPYGFYAELPPRTASVVTDLSAYQWQDSDWMQQRSSTNQLNQPISIYEVHLGSWKKCATGVHGWMNYRQLAHELVDYCHQFGFTHLELLPISEHPFTGSWGYQTVGYFSVTSRYGTPEDFMYFVDHCHRNGIGVIIDWVPAHFPKDAHGLRQFDGTALFEHADPRQGEHPDWGTMIFNFGRNEVRNFLVANALFWLDKYHIDGLRVDAVASMLYLDYSREDGQWIPNAYGGRENLEAIHLLREFNEQAHELFPGVLTIAEESTAWPGVSRPTEVGGLGFSLKWNMGWMNDTLRYMRNEPIHRSHHHDELTFSLVYAFTENFALPLSHDEVVHGKGALLAQMAGDLWQKFANLRLLYAYMWTHPGKKLLFMGSEFGQWHEWNYDDQLQWDLLDWDTHRGLQRMVGDLNHLVIAQPALHQIDFDPQGFEWIDCMNRSESVISYIRRGEDPAEWLIVCCNFTPVVREYRLAVPQAGYYAEVFNSDSSFYGGSNIGNHPGVWANDVPHFGRAYSVDIKLPPLATVVFKPQN